MYYSKLSHLASTFRPSSSQATQHFTRNAFPSTATNQAFNSVGASTNPSSSSSASSSSSPHPNGTDHANNGHGAGGSKWGAGSRVPHWAFQQVRLVSQPPTADPTVRISDDDDDLHPSSRRRARQHIVSRASPQSAVRKQSPDSSLQRPRRNSTSLSGQVEDRLSRLEMHRQYWAAFQKQQEARQQPSKEDLTSSLAEFNVEADDQEPILAPQIIRTASESIHRHQPTIPSLLLATTTSSIRYSPIHLSSARTLHTSAARSTVNPNSSSPAKLSPSAASISFTLPSSSSASNPSTLSSSFEPPRADIPRRRRNSTSSIVTPTSSSESLPEADFFLKAARTPKQHISTSIRPPVSDPNDARSTQSKLLRKVFPKETDHSSATHQSVLAARKTRSYQLILRAVDEYLALDPKKQTTVGHNVCMQSLLQFRDRGTSIDKILSIYEDLFNKPNIRPDNQSYKTVISALCTRDIEVVEEIKQIETKASDHVGAKAKLDQLKSHNYLATAIDIFKALGPEGDRLGSIAFDDLIRAAAHRQRIELAISLFSRLEQSTLSNPTPDTYRILINMFADAGEKEAASDVFEAFVQTANNASSAGAEIVWRAMIAALFETGDDVGAVALLERLLNAIDNLPAKGKPGHRPGYPTKISDAMLAEVIQGFATTGDLESAERWFARADKPDLLTFSPTIQAAVKAGKVDLANNIYQACTSSPDSVLDAPVLSSLVSANLAVGSQSHDRIASQMIADFSNAMHDHKVAKLPKELRVSFLNDFLPHCVRSLVSRGEHELCLPALDMLTSLTGDIVKYGRMYSDLSPKQWALRLGDTVASVLGLNVKSTVEGGRSTYERATKVPIKIASHALTTLNAIWDAAAIEREPQFEVALVDSFLAYLADNNNAVPALDQREWFTVIEAFALVASYEAKAVVPIHFEFPGFEPVIDFFFSGAKGEPLAREHDRDYSILIRALEESGMSRSRVIAVLSLLDPQVEAILKHKESTASVSQQQLTPPSSEIGSAPSPNLFEPAPSLAFAEVLPTPPAASLDGLPEVLPTPPATPPEYFSSLPSDQSSPNQNVKIDMALTQRISDLGRSSRLDEALKVMREGVRLGAFAHPDVLGRLIELLGRQGKVDQVRETYLIAYTALGGLPDQREQSVSWIMLEDHMIIALAHAGALEEVAVHRIRLLQHGSAPSADGYAAMILNMHETTDDAAVAVELFEESQRHGVAPNVYLFNTLISKLSRARRAREVLEYFELMKASGIQPSSITYGAVINACCKTGDDASAEYLFKEMVAAPGFRPRIPPYNTLIQFFTSTKPSRERALHYYDQLLAAKVSPTGHTYKLLLDAYGTVGEPDLHSMSDVFEALLADRNVSVTGAHWASLINAWGTVSKNLDRAIAIFNSIERHPSTLKAKSNQPDAVVYESLINALTANGRADLCQTYVDHMKARGVHMTAYVANSIIRAYGIQGNLEASRQMFESMADPQMGVAAAGNHLVDRHPKNNHQSSSVTEGVVYREPSTWETMIRCELAAGEIERASALLVRLNSRGFPEPVVERIRNLVLEAEAARESSESAPSQTADGQNPMSSPPSTSQ